MSRQTRTYRTRHGAGLWTRERGTIVNKRIVGNHPHAQLCLRRLTDVRPIYQAPLRQEIDRINALVYTQNQKTALPDRLRHHQAAYGRPFRARFRT